MRKWRFVASAFVILLITLLVEVKAEAAYFPPGSSTANGIEDMVLIYSGYYDPANYGNEDISAWPRSQFKPYTAFVDRQGIRQDTFFRDYLFLGLKSPNGRSFHQVSNSSQAGLKGDWEWFLDRIFTTQTEQLEALNDETAAVANSVGDSGMKNGVVIMVPFANENVTSFGDVDGDGISENLTYLSNREKVTEWYIDEAIQRFNQANYSHLELKGFYWLQEDLDTSNSDEVNLVKNTGDYIHNQGDYVFCWIPWSQAYAATQWSSFNFDFAILQPNHFVNRSNTTTPETIEDSANTSANAGMGVELEFDLQILRSDKYRERFYDYLNGGIAYDFMDQSILGYYQDARGIYELTLDETYGYPIYEDLYRFVKGTYEGDTQTLSMLNTFESQSFSSSASATASVSGSYAVQGNNSMKVDFGYYNTSLVTGNYSGDFGMEDWSDFDSFRLDVYNPTSSEGAVTVIVGDVNGKQHYKYKTLYKNSWNTVRILIDDLAAGTNGSAEEPGTQAIDVSQISYIKLVQRNNAYYPALPNTYYFDNMRLIEDDGLRINNVEWLPFGGNSSVTLTRTETTIREQNRAMKVDFGLYNVAQTWLQSGVHYTDSDWSGREAFKADIYNPNGSVMNLGVKFTDGANKTYYKRVSLQPGMWNTIQIPLQDIASGSNGTSGEGTSQALALNNISRVDFYQRNNANYLSLPNHLYFDNIRLGVLEP